MSRTIDINPVTRIEGHAKVHVEISDQGDVQAAYLQVMEFRGFEKFVQGMQVEMMPTITSRICGTCPHAHHLVAAKAVDKVFSVRPPRAAVLLRELLNAGSIIHSHAIHFFVLAGPDLLLGIDAPAAKRNIVGLLEAHPELAKKALRLRSLGQKITEIIGGRGTHPVTCIAGGVSTGIDQDKRHRLQLMANEALELAQVALDAGTKALESKPQLITSLPLDTYNMGTVKNGILDLYDGQIKVTCADGSDVVEFNCENYANFIFEEALENNYSKQVFFKDAQEGSVIYRVGPLARINCASKFDTPKAQAALDNFRENYGVSTNQTVLGHYARLIEMLHCAEKAVIILSNDEILSDNIVETITATPKNAIAHIEAPRGLLIHDYKVDTNGIVQDVNLLVATQHNMSSINKSIEASAKLYFDKSDEELMNRIEFAIRCFDPCLSCSTHQVGKMPLDVSITQNGKIIRKVKRGSQCPK